MRQASDLGPAWALMGQRFSALCPCPTAVQSVRRARSIFCPWRSAACNCDCGLAASMLHDRCGTSAKRWMRGSKPGLPESNPAAHRLLASVRTHALACKRKLRAVTGEKRHSLIPHEQALRELGCSFCERLESSAFQAAAPCRRCAMASAQVCTSPKLKMKFERLAACSSAVKAEQPSESMTVR